MIKKRRNLFIMLVVIVLMLSTTVGVIVASSNGTRFNNTILASRFKQRPVDSNQSISRDFRKNNQR